jgi:hypothetical protein
MSWNIPNNYNKDSLKLLPEFEGLNPSPEVLAWLEHVQKLIAKNS